MAGMANPGKHKSPPGSSTRTLFIVSSNADKVNLTTRKLIRSHVMQGKKRKRGHLSDHQGRHRWSPTASRTPQTSLSLEATFESSAPLLSARVGSDLSFVNFADDIEPSLAINIIKFSTIATKVIYPLLMAIGLRPDATPSLGPIGTDAAVLHITAFAVDGFVQRILRHQGTRNSPAAMLHLQKGLRILRTRLLLEDDATMLSDSTMSAIVKLADTSHFDGDRHVAKQHMDGLRKIVDSRGGMMCVGGTRLMVEVLRCDLRIAILGNSNPVFYRQPSEPIPDYPPELLPASNDRMFVQDNVDLLRKLDKDLALTWRVMKRFCMLVNLGTQTNRQIYPEYIHETMVSVIYRLLNMAFAVGSLDEAVRLGLIEFSHHAFLQWQDIKLPRYPFLDTFRNCILGLDLVDGVSSEVSLWMLMTAAISLFKISDEVWLRDCLRTHLNLCRIETWKALNELLKRFMWIALLDDEPGRRNFDLLLLEEEKQ